MAKTSTQAAPAPAAEAPPAADKPLQARVLVRCAFGEVDDVVQLPAAEIQAGKDAGELDPHPDAVAYALSLKAKPPAGEPVIE